MHLAAVAHVYRALQPDRVAVEALRAQLAGDALHSGIGGDTDGQGGRECAPADVDSIVDYHKIAEILRSRGYSEGDVENVMWRNWIRLFDRALPAR